MSFQLSFLILLLSFLFQVKAFYLSPYNSFQSSYPTKSWYSSYGNSYPYYQNAVYRSDPYYVYPSYNNFYNPYPNYQNSFYRNEPYGYQNSYPMYNPYQSSYYSYPNYQNSYYPYYGYQNSYAPYQNSYYPLYNSMENRIDGGFSIRMGDGSARMVGKDAELVCNFPPNEYIVSDITWTKPGSPFIPNMTYRSQSARSADFHTGTLYVRDVGPQDFGYYRCTTKAQRGGTFVTLYTDVYLQNYGFPRWF